MLATEDNTGHVLGSRDIPITRPVRERERVSLCHTPSIQLSRPWSIVSENREDCHVSNDNTNVLEVCECNHRTQRAGNL
jgi:hypothetical protein